MEIDAVSELDRQRDRTDEEAFRDRIDHAANNSRMEPHSSNVVGTKFSTPWKRGGRKARKRTSAVY